MCWWKPKAMQISYSLIGIIFHILIHEKSRSPMLKILQKYNQVVKNLSSFKSLYAGFSTFNEFITCFHQFVSPAFSKNHSQFEQLKKKTNFLLVQNRSFSRFASWKRNLNKYSFKKNLDSEFEIGENNWWIC